MAAAAANEQNRFLALVGWIAIPIFVVVAVLAVAITRLCGGQLVLPLDDPYISLALTERLAHGHYGLNGSEITAASSSILFPFVLLVPVICGLGVASALLVNGIALLLMSALFAWLAVRLGFARRPETVAPAAILLFVLLLATGSVGLVFIGLEHLIHALFSAAILYGLFEALETRRIPRWLVPAIVINPLWRLEGAAESLLACGAIYCAGWRRMALLACGATLGLVGLYALAMILCGLPPLPTSVLSKWNFFGHKVPGGLPATIADNILRSVRDAFEAKPLVVVLILMLAKGCLSRIRTGRSDDLLLALVCSGMIVAHFAFGGWAWLARYAVYLYAASAVTLLILYRTWIAAFLERMTGLRFAAAFIAIVAWGTPVLLVLVVTPQASRGIYQQQFQMRRFVVDFYRAPVAANDVGLLSYDNPNFVLDLFGTTSEEAREARLAHRPDWMETLAAEHDTGLAMIYPFWFADDIPAQWRPLAVFTTTDPTFINAGRSVTLYATRDDAEAPIRAALAAFDAVPHPEMSITPPATPSVEETR